MWKVARASRRRRWAARAALRSAVRCREEFANSMFEAWNRVNDLEHEVGELRATVEHVKSTKEDPEPSEPIELHAGSFPPPGSVVARLVIAPEDESIVDELISKVTGARKQTSIGKLLEENKELRETLHRFQHGMEIESDYICGYGHELLSVIAERDELRAKLERWEKSDRNITRTWCRVPEEE